MHGHNEEEDRYIYPTHDIEVSAAFEAFYYGFVMPLCYIGTILTCMVGARIVTNNRTIYNIIITALLCNEFFTVMMVHTPTMIAYSRKHWFGKQICIYHAFFYAFFTLNKFLCIVLLAAERYWAIVKPFHYARVARLYIAFILVALLVTISFVFSITCAFSLPATLLPGWYCTHVTIAPTKNCSEVSTKTSSEVCPQDINWEAYYASLCIIFFAGFALASVFNVRVLIELNRKRDCHVDAFQLERRMSITIQVLGVAFFVTWLPTWVSTTPIIINTDTFIGNVTTNHVDADSFCL